MQAITDQVHKRTEELAARHGFSHEAVLALFQALSAGHGALAQFDHPELGGMGQWTRGGMIMIGDMFNAALRARVNSLCQELSSLLDEQSDLKGQEPSLVESQRPSGRGTYGGETLGEWRSGEPSVDWWAAELGAPSSSGSQGNVRYAYFPETQRLAISTGGKVTVYDTQDHEITGFSQQQGSEATLTFASQHGPVPVDRMQVVGMAGDAAAMPAGDLSTERHVNQASDTDVFSKIERLAELSKKGIVSEEEFVAKKAELLARLS